MYLRLSFSKLCAKFIDMPQKSDIPLQEDGLSGTTASQLGGSSLYVIGEHPIRRLIQQDILIDFVQLIANPVALLFTPADDISLRSLSPKE